jgi:hypothetical protein
MVLTRHADLEVGRRSRRLLLLGGLGEPGLDGEDNSNPAPSQYGTSHEMEMERPTSRSSCAAHFMSVAVIEQTHVGSAVLVSSEDLGYHISRATWEWDDGTYSSHWQRHQQDCSMHMEHATHSTCRSHPCSSLARRRARLRVLDT